MVLRYMPTSGPWGPPGIPFMTIFVFYVNPQIPNIENFDAYGGLQIPGGSSSFFSSNFPSNAVGIMSGDPFLTRVMTIFIKAYIFVKGREGEGREGKEGKERERVEGTKEGRKGGRKEGRKGGREEGRKEGREEGRKGGRGYRGMHVTSCLGTLWGPS